MFFLNEHLVAAFLSIAAFIVCFGACLYSKVSLLSALLRSSLVAFLFMFAGLFLGTIMKNLIVEAFLREDLDKLKQEEGAQKEKQEVIDEE